MNLKQTIIAIIIFILMLIVISLPLWWDYVTTTLPPMVASMRQRGSSIWDILSIIFKAIFDYISGML
ncbi:MAG: hypothetical protein SVY15_07565 [Halobacteriota archaeon]|nr:hypothetical protein [Halobacteriota archaeon]